MSFIPTKIKAIGLIATVFLFACAKKSTEVAVVTAPNNSTPTSDVIDYVRSTKNGLCQRQSKEEVIYGVLYKPSEYIISVEHKNDPISKGVIKKERQQLKDMQYIDFTIAVKNYQKEVLSYNANSEEEYNKRLTYCSFEMQKDFSLVDGADTLACTLFHHERAGNITPFLKFVLAFPKTNNTKSDKILLFNDKLFNKGLIEFSFKSKDISQTPKL